MPLDALSKFQYNHDQYNLNPKNTFLITNQIFKKIEDFINKLKNEIKHKKLKLNYPKRRTNRIKNSVMNGLLMLKYNQIEFEILLNRMKRFEITLLIKIVGAQLNNQCLCYKVSIK